MTRPLLSATLICRDEKQNVTRCLDGIWPHVDELVVVDTGSTDGTLGEVARYARRHRGENKLKTARIQWTDDFAAARQKADDLATGRWLVWADFDDTVIGLAALRKMAADAGEDVRGYFCRYDYAQDPDGNCISELWRERVVRNDGTRWTGRLHEHKLLAGGGIVVKVDPQIAEWRHRRDHTQRTGERNTRILEAWLADSPDDPRVISSLAMEYMGADRYREASDMFARFLGCPGEPPDRRSQATRHMCVMLMLQGRVQEARAHAFQALAEHWEWADTHLTLAEAEQTLGRPEIAIHHARNAVAVGKPETLLIVNPLQYTAHPHALMAVCLAQMGRWEEAVSQAEECLAIAPSYQLAAQHLPGWRGQLKRQHTVSSVLALAEVMVETGELHKAVRLLDDAPYFVVDDPRLIARRSEIRRLIGRRIANHQLPVDEAADRFVERHLKEAA